VGGADLGRVEEFSAFSLIVVDYSLKTDTNLELAIHLRKSFEFRPCAALNFRILKEIPLCQKPQQLLRHANVPWSLNQTATAACDCAGF